MTDVDLVALAKRAGATKVHVNGVDVVLVQATEILALISAVRERDERIEMYSNALKAALTVLDDPAVEQALPKSLKLTISATAQAVREDATTKAESRQHMPDMNEKGKKQ